jgi:hypothetical protein
MLSSQISSSEKPQFLLDYSIKMSKYLQIELESLKLLNTRNIKPESDNLTLQVMHFVAISSGVAAVVWTGGAAAPILMGIGAGATSLEYVSSAAYDSFLEHKREFKIAAIEKLLKPLQEEGGRIFLEALLIEYFPNREFIVEEQRALSKFQKPFKNFYDALQGKNLYHC